MSFDKLANQREYRRRNGNIHTKKYEKTKNGFLMRLFSNMTSRISGIQKKKFHLYEGKTLDFTKEQFYSWALNSEEFTTLFKQYEESGYARKLAPSVDRIDSTKGYSFSNIEWVTMGENSARAARQQHQKNSCNS